MNEALLRQAIEAIWNRGDLDAADEVFAPGFVNHSGVIVDLVVGPEAIKISALLHRLAFPDLFVVVENLSVDDNTAVVEWAAKRRSVPGLGDGITIGSSQELLRGTTRSRVASGKIIESWTEWDWAEMLRGLRIVPTG